MKLDRFLADLSSHKNGLGGGAAAALAGATGAALIEMVAGLNDKRLKKSSGTAAKAASLRKKMLVLIQKDAKAFRGIQKAYKLRHKKPAGMESALKNGVKPPLEMARLAFEAWKLIQKERSRTSKWLMGDLMESFLLMDVVHGSVLLNAGANLTGIKDRAFAARTSKQLKKWEVHRELWR